jgi:DNA-binding transcriptional MocR family regulator
MSWYKPRVVTAQGYGISGGTARQIAASIEEGVRQGRFQEGAALPSVRDLASALDVAPGTVASAYRALAARGLVRGEGRRGTRIATRAPLRSRSSAPIPTGARDLASGNPLAGLLPRFKTALRASPPEQRMYGETENLPELMALFAAELDRDGIPTDAMALVGGAMDGIERVLAAHLLPGDRVAVEDPGYPPVVDLLIAMNLIPEPVTVDDAGPVPAELDAALRGGVKAVIVTTRAQNPTGAALDTRRARELSKVLASAPDVLLLEDDHAGRVAGVDAVSLSSPDRERWAVVRSVSKSLGPDIRLAVLAGDPGTIARVSWRQVLGTGWVSGILQQLVLSLLRDPDVDAMLRTAAETYSERRLALLDALSRRGIEAHGRSGLNVWVPVDDEASVARSMLDAGWAISTGERFRIRSGPAVRITISTLDPDEADRVAADLARALVPTRPSRTT